MLTVLSAGLPISAKELLKSAMDDVFGGTVEIQELTKENLRSRVRLSVRSVEVVLVILDSVSSELCADIENGLYKSDKYYAYTSDRGLAEFLNSKYNLNIVVEEVEEVSKVEEGVFNDSGEKSYHVDEDIEKMYQEKLQFKDSTIRNLESQIRYITDFYGVEGQVGVASEELDSLKDENIRLNNDLLDCRSEVDRLKSERVDAENLNKEKANLENRIKKLSKNYDDVLHELNELKVTYSTQSGVIRDKENKIAELSEKISSLEGYKNEVSVLKENIQDYKSMVSDKDAEIGDLTVDLQSKEREVSRCLEELESLRGLTGVSDKLDSANATITSLKAELNSITSDRDRLTKELGERNRELQNLRGSSDSDALRIEELTKENKKLSDRVELDNESLARLNKEKLDLQNKLSILNKASDNKDSVDELIKEVQDLQRKLSVATSNVFTKIGTSALPNGSSGVRLISGEKYKNIRFAFSGSAESRKGSYRCLLEEFRANLSDTRYLLVDLVTETFVDYIFEIKKLVSGVEWFRKGGSVQQYISSTVLKNTKVLSVGLGYINDSYFLCIDWAKRLRELDNSGYQVVVFCGDVSNIIGRVLHESFAGCGKSTIYVSGSIVGSRTIITNLRGLGNATTSEIVYFDFNAAAKKFYDMVDKTNKCRVITTRSSARR